MRNTNWDVAQLETAFVRGLSDDSLADRLDSMADRLDSMVGDRDTDRVTALVTEAACRLRDRTP